VTALPDWYRRPGQRPTRPQPAPKQHGSNDQRPIDPVRVAMRRHRPGPAARAAARAQIPESRHEGCRHHDRERRIPTRPQDREHVEKAEYPAVSVSPETTSPAPKHERRGTPRGLAWRASRCVTHDCDHQHRDAMNVTVAAIEPWDRREMPQMPWPEVHAAPSRVPIPTRSPAMAMMMELAWPDRRAYARPARAQAAHDQSGAKQAACTIAAAALKEIAENAADPGDAAGQQHQERLRQGR